MQHITKLFRKNGPQKYLIAQHGKLRVFIFNNKTPGQPRNPTLAFDRTDGRAVTVHDLTRLLCDQKATPSESEEGDGTAHR